MSNNIKYHYDQDQGVYVKESDLSVNWLLSEVLQIPKLQISKISNEDVQKFLYILDKSDLRMPDGRHSIVWIKDDLKQKLEMSKNQLGQAWSQVTDRYRYILQQIDLMLAVSPEKQEIIKNEEKKDAGLTENKMECEFERKEKNEENKG